MSLSAKNATKSVAPIRDRILDNEADQEIREYLEGVFDSRYWELSQEEADELAEMPRPQWRKEFSRIMASLKSQGKSAGARYIAGRILSGSDPDLRQLTQDWFATKNIRSAVSAEELREIDASPAKLRHIGIRHQREAKEFCSLYREVMVKGRPWGSSYQPSHHRVAAVATTPNYNRLPLWVKKAMVNSSVWISTDPNRIGNIWRFVSCAKAWKHSPHLPKAIAEKVGKMSVKARILSYLAWELCKYFEGRGERQQAFWQNLQGLLKKRLPQVVAAWTGEGPINYNLYTHNALRLLSEATLGLPHGFLFKEWGYRQDASIEHYLRVISRNGTPSKTCKALFGVAGKATIAAFSRANSHQWCWASALGDGNADVVQTILKMDPIIEWQPEAIDFLLSLPMVSRLRLLQATTFRYRGTEQLVSDDHIRDTGYLWKNIKQKPELGRIRCWFRVHEQLSAAFVKELPDEALPIPAGWECVDGLNTVHGKWSLELPKRVATLKYYGEAMGNCVGGYGPAIKSGRSVIFVVREHGLLTHCVEVSRGFVQQFYRSGNSSPDREIQEAVEATLRQAGLIQ